ncbi:hypothetical protein AAFF_G00361210 [Aldrovandia affinis]|uniref:Uncharacterized protein n=1 Tax=Aldrovandia affinis TaxID=143900 RepID=A0AAD7R5B2_9TELE|nr:hypothetical protein AAFF_G00361210 [Aldrovandia affinis]
MMMTFTTSSLLTLSPFTPRHAQWTMRMDRHFSGISCLSAGLARDVEVREEARLPWASPEHSHRIGQLCGRALCCLQSCVLTGVRQRTAMTSSERAGCCLNSDPKEGLQNRSESQNRGGGREGTVLIPGWPLLQTLPPGHVTVLTPVRQAAGQMDRRMALSTHFAFISSFPRFLVTGSRLLLPVGFTIRQQRTRGADKGDLGTSGLSSE